MRQEPQQTHARKHGNEKLKTHLKGPELLGAPLLNKGAAFNETERKLFDLDGLLPPQIESITTQVARAYDAFSIKQSDIEKHIYLRSLQDRNETLFYKLILQHLTEMMPIIYTPVVGDACKSFSHIYRQQRGLFISYPYRNRIEEVLDNAPIKDVRVIVVTDGERILGLGDQGAGGMGIPIGKLSLYTACGGINPANTLPILLDVGTNNKDLIDDPTYIGWRHERIVDKDYDDFLDAFVQAVKKKYPHVLLQFEDFAQQHAYPLLERYRDQLCTFNDDIQGTAAVAVSAIIAAVKASNTKLKDHKIVVLGAGSAGCGISEQLVRAMVNDGMDEADARSRFYMIDRVGLLLDNTPSVLPFQKNLLQKHEVVADWQLQKAGYIGLEDVINNAKPTILLGVSGQPDQFKESMVKHMATYCDRPIIFPMSNPTSRCEAKPVDLIKWTKGKALVATGSPFDDVEFEGNKYPIAQSNNSYIFPGMGLGIVAIGAKRVSDDMFMAATLALSDAAPALHEANGALLPDLEDIREVSKKIAFAVAKKAVAEGLADKLSEEEMQSRINATMWEPEYREMEPS